MDRNTFLKMLGFSTLGLSVYGLSGLNKILSSAPNSQKMPVLFLGHGSPMNAIEENEFVQGFRDAAKQVPKPLAILCISAHWFTSGTKVTAMDMPRTIHDFGGFPKALYEVQYPAKGDPELAKATIELLSPVHVEADHSWGLDHGAWSVIKHMYPDADIPVIQMSIDYTKGPAYHFDLAVQLKKLREKGVLIIGSGNIVHNLRLVDWNNLDKVDYGFDWAQESRQKINTWIMDHDVKPLLEYEKQGRALQLAVPTPDHYLPLIYTLGLKDSKEEVRLFNDKLLAGSLSMTSVHIG
ncbi:MAG: 4,5-DOPA dioxygenase extradiol [Chitinophagales bacterium]|nr:4,5-DOPA dioxygenase extradiol [Chitinophagales bacterium]